MAEDLTVGAVIAGRYRLDRLLAEGGMGVVWAAKHVVTRKPVALKFVKGEAANDERTRRRLLREAKAACAVQHPNVVAVHDVMELESGSPVLVMDLLKGESLRAKLDREGQIPLHDLANILIPVVSAVGTAHSSGVVHRDLKPENIFLALMPGGAMQVKVLDFGIAKLTSSEGLMAHSGALTGTGLLLGTPDYMSVEQILGEEDVDHRADIWALGIVLYECLNGHRPTAAENVGKVLKTILTNAIVPIHQAMPQLPEDIKTLISRMLTLDRAGRPANLIEVGRTLERYGTVPLLPFELPRSRPMSEAPPGPPIALPSTKVGAPRPPRVFSDSGSRTLGASRQAFETGDTMAARPPTGSRPLLASHPINVPPQLLTREGGTREGGQRESGDPGIPIALDEPFSIDAVSSDRQLTMGNKSLTLGDLLSPDELAMLGERLERAQSSAPGPLGGMPSEAVEEEAPISESEFMPASVASPAIDDDSEPVVSEDPPTLVGGLQRREGVHSEPLETLPPTSRPEDKPTLPFAAPKGLRRPGSQDLPFSTPSTPRSSGGGLPPASPPARLSFGEVGGSKELPQARPAFGNAGASRSAQVATSPATARSTEVLTPHTSAAPTPASMPIPSFRPRRGPRVVAIAGLGCGAAVALWLLFKPPPSPTEGDHPQGSASATTSASAPTPPVASPGTCPPDMVLIPGDTFAMGAAEGHADERPVHEVVVQTFCMDLTEVTAAAFQRCVDDNHCEPLTKTVTASTTSKDPMSTGDRSFESSFCQDPKRDGGGKAFPVNCVNWTDANTYCRVQGKRLPTEEEWEYAARGGAEARLYPWGAAPPSAKLVNACGSECEKLYVRAKRRKSSLYSDNDGHAGLAPVGSFPAGDTRFGNHDMSGNVWEWTASAHCTYPSHSCSNPSRVFRGGSFVSSSAQTFSGATRMSGSPENRYMDVGFRCAKDRP